MALLQPPSTAENGCYTARQDRLMWASLICEPGVDRPDSMVVTGFVELSVIVSGGGAWVYGDTIPDQGYYYVFNDADVTVTLDAADPTDGRIDLIVVTVHDSEYTGTVDEGVITSVTGTPSPDPVAPATPDNSIILSEVYVPAGSTGGIGLDDSTRQHARICSGMTGTTAPDPDGIALNTSNTGSPELNPGTTWYGTRFVGNMVQLQLAFRMAVSVTAGATGNITDLPLGVVAEPYRPSEFTPGLIGPSAAAPWYGGVSTNGSFQLYAATFPGATLAVNDLIRVNLLYPRSDI